METLSEIKNKMNKNRDLIARLERERELNRQYKRDILFNHNLNEEMRERLGSKRAEDEKIAKRATIAKINGLILKNNYRYVVYKSVFPEVLAILSGFAGKTLGEKTYSKLREAVYKKLNFRIYLEKESITIQDNITSVTIGIKNEAAPVISNKAINHGLNVEDFIIYFEHINYIENAAEYIKELEKRHKKLLKAIAAFQSAQKELNALIIQGLNECNDFIRYNKYFY